MGKIYRNIVKFSLILFAAVCFQEYFENSVFAASKVVEVKNGSTGEVRINEDDFITFVPEGMNKNKGRYFFYSAENGNNFYQFGNGKFWANKKGMATVVISGLDKNGNLNFMADYKVIIEAAAKLSEAEEKQLQSEKVLADVSGVTLSKTSLSAKRTKIGAYDNDVTSFNIAVNSPVKLSELLNANLSVAGSNADMKISAFLDNNILSIDVYNSGTSVLTVDINGKKFNVNISVVDNEISSTSLVIAEGKSARLNIRGEGSSNIEWFSSNTNVAEVDGTGKVFGKAKGNAIITARVNGKTFGSVVSVTSELRKKAVDYAKAYAAKSVYSQARRMEEGYYDCSSLVWRAYNKYGLTILQEGYAPVAAAMGQYYFENAALVDGGLSDINIKNMAFEPGDLFFVEGQPNGRFRGIYHVEMISGYTFRGFDSAGNALVGVEFAARNQSDFKGFVGKP